MARREREQGSAEKKVAGIARTFALLEAARPQVGSLARSSHLWPAATGSRERFHPLQKMDTSRSVGRGSQGLGSWGRTAGRLSVEQKPEQSPEVLSFALDPLEHEWLLTAAQGDADNIARLLDLDPSLLTRKDFVMGFTALHWLAKHGHYESFIQVISHAQKKGYPVNMNIPSASGGFTPLHLAAMQGHELLIKVLVGAYGADTSRRDHSGRKAWQYLRADTSRELKELAGALEEDLVQLRSHNTNNNCKSSREARAGRDCVDSGAEGKAQSSWSLSTLRTFVRQAFTFFQER
uniref:Sosondowah ankyrin repeat domain family member D n=1 Tax=Strix occidentalis caurina TaxID=311401 RepID=A0A8D0EKV0_STROC